MKNNVSSTQKLAESGLMLALATLLSLFKLADLPYGGSITAASMLPVLIIALRHGAVWGVFTGFAHGLLQLILGSSVLSWVTGWQAVVAVIVLEYLLAFAVLGLGGLCRKMQHQPSALALGSLIACALRYLLHVIAGCTVWAGLSIPTGDALIYSIIYNATYMIPETIVTVCAAWYLASVLNFRAARLSAAKQESLPAARILSAVAGFAVLGGVAADCALIFPCLQDAESGEFAITGIAQVNWLAVVIVTVACLLLAAVLLLLRRRVTAKKEATKE